MNIQAFLNKQHLILIAIFVIITFQNCSDYTPKYNAIEVKQAPIIDGNIDEIWNKTKIDTINKSIIGYKSRKDDKDFTVNFRSLWDSTSIYFLFVVSDDIKLFYPEILWYENDLVQIFIGRLLKKVGSSKIHPGDILQYTFIYSIDSLLLNGQYLTKTKIEFKIRDTNNGYILEVKIPWSEIGIVPKNNLDIPVNFEATDLDKKESAEGIIGIRETIIGWAPNTADRSWAQTKTFGDIILIQ